MLNWSAIDKLPACKRQLCYSFGSVRPKLAWLPHLIGRQGRALGDAVLEVGGTAGIWGQYPLVDSKGQPFLPPWNGEQSESFGLWRLPENQLEVRDYLEGRDTEQFSMLIPCSTERSLLEQLDSLDVPFNDYYFYIERVSYWVDRLGWAYIPLEYEGEFSMFVAAERRNDLVVDLAELLATKGISFFSLKRDGECDEWSWPE